MHYSEELLNEMNFEFATLKSDYYDSIRELETLKAALTRERSIEYLQHGVMRRLGTLIECIEIIFTSFPPDRTHLLNRSELKLMAICLHAFFINLSGLLDNLAWVVANEDHLVGKGDGKLSKTQVDLFKGPFQSHLAPRFVDFLKSKETVSWYQTYTKDFRDTLAHRIPLYVAPYLLYDDKKAAHEELSRELAELDTGTQVGLDRFGEIMKQMESLGEVSYTFAHSIGEGSAHVFIHPQVLSDSGMVRKIISSFCESWPCRVE